MYGLTTWQHSAHAKMRIDHLTIERTGAAPVSLDVEMALSDQEKALGLMFRTELADTTGMLFPYGISREITMWMHNTYIPLDMLFIRTDGIIHRIEVRAEPLSDRVISSGGEVSAVLELAAGAAERLGIKPGDKVIHPSIAGKTGAATGAANGAKTDAQTGAQTGAPPSY